MNIAGANTCDGVFMDSGLALAARPGMTGTGNAMADTLTIAGRTLVVSQGI